MISKELSDFISLSKSIGEKVCYVQGCGGNTSIKLDSKRMIIKASGVLLKDMRDDYGYSVVDYPSIIQYTAHADSDDDVFSQKINSFITETSNRPSIEAGLHALLGKIVVHSHSVFSNLLACSNEGWKITQELFPDSLWLSYAAPGKSITDALRYALNSIKITPQIIFLENHGLVISAETTHNAFDLHEFVNMSICKYLGINFKDITELPPFTDLSFAADHVFFPDQVVFTCDPRLRVTQAGKETLMAYNYLWREIGASKILSPRFISHAESLRLLTMESEKYRQRISL